MKDVYFLSSAFMRTCNKNSITLTILVDMIYLKTKEQETLGSLTFWAFLRLKKKY